MHSSQVLPNQSNQAIHWSKVGGCRRCTTWSVTKWHALILELVPEADIQSWWSLSEGLWEGQLTQSRLEVLLDLLCMDYWTWDEQRDGWGSSHSLFSSLTCHLHKVLSANNHMAWDIWLTNRAWTSSCGQIFQFTLKTWSPLTRQSSKPGKSDSTWGLTDYFMPIQYHRTFHYQLETGNDRTPTSVCEKFPWHVKAVGGILCYMLIYLTLPALLNW